MAPMVLTIDDPSTQEIDLYIEDGGTFESEAFVSFQSKLRFDANDVLVPDTLWVFGLAFIGLIGIRRKRIKR